MKLYNTLTRQIDDIKPLKSGEISVYTCGPTVYDYAHIGHWFNYVRMDTLIRTLSASGLKTNWVMNITDVGHLVSDADDGEDKLEKGARREGKSAWEVAEIYTKDFLECMDILHITKPSHLVKATEHIPEQIELIKKLETKGYTYIIDDGVYYDTSKFSGYSAFARLDLDDQQGTGRVISNPQKHNSQDFALWKFSPKNSKRDMEWESPWGVGFPGWHIECSAMSMKYLGETLDIHTGGIDHIPVHHTNEIAQSEAVTGKRFSQVWMHSNHVMVDGEKISKSLGNGIRLQDILSQDISPEAVRLHILESHYRSHSKFSMDSLAAAQNRLQVYQAMADLKWQTNDKSPNFNFDLVDAQLQNSVESDLDTPKSLVILSELETNLTETLINTTQLKTYQKLLNYIDELFGLELCNRPDITIEQKKILAQRAKARTDENWKLSDELRTLLANQNIALRDTNFGQIWSRL